MIDSNEAEEKWLQEKWGRFGASDIYKLLSKGKGEMFGVGAKTLIKKIARQAYTMFNTQDSIETYAMKMGKVLEPQSFGYVYSLLRVPELTHFGGANPLFHLHSEERFRKEAGCSPDGAAIKKDGSFSFGLELKNNSGDTHWSSLSEVKNQKDLLDKNKDDYAQCQFSMACCNTDLWLWVSYNEFFPDKDKALIIEVTPDKEFMDELNVRLSEAIKLKYEYIEEMKKI